MSFVMALLRTTQSLVIVSALSLAFIGSAASMTPNHADPDPPQRTAVLVELFTSEGCSSCPPADELLRQISGHTTPQGQLIIGLSEHVRYWDYLGWKDPYSSDTFTSRQSAFSEHFGLDSVYTPQMVVNGSEQFVGGDRRALAAAFAREVTRAHIDLHINSAQVTANRLVLNYSAANLPSHRRLRLFAVLVDDQDESSVHAGENSGKKLIHASVARELVPLGQLNPTDGLSTSLQLPESFLADSHKGHHLVLFAQDPADGAVLGADTTRI
jgi:hypothetical protein